MESDAMWRLYCDQVGVCVSTTVSQLKASISCRVPKLFASDFKLSLEHVVYKDTDFCGDTRPWLIKRSAFQHEHEMRLFVDCPFGYPAFELQVEPHQLIAEITMTPYAKKWQADVMKAAVERLLPAIMSKFQQSTHLDASDPVWPG
jgi:hypothetical protein